MVAQLSMTLDWAILAAMPAPEFLSQALTVLAAALAVTLLSARLRVPPVVGFLLSGVLIGPSGLALVAEVERVEAFAEIGVVLLLFVIGLQLNPQEMKGLGRSFVAGGSLQWGLTTVATTAVGVAVGLPLVNALFIGFVVSLSSTAVVLKQYQERRETSTPQGRLVLGVLLFQDLLIVPVIALTPLLAGTVAASAKDLVLRFGGALAVVSLVFFAGRALMPRLARLVAATRARELFVLGALTTCLAMAWFTARLEFSLALGAFLAGLLIAETDYAHQVIADIGPFRDLFASIFFVSIGMLLDLSQAMEHLPLVIVLASLLIVGKALLALAAFKLAGFTTRIAVVSAIGLAQIGEFSFVLMEVGRAHGLLEAGRFQLLLMAAVITIAATPFLVRLAEVAGRQAARMASARDHGESPAAEGRSGHVLIVGYGMNGSILARVLSAVRIPHVILELNPDTVRRAREQGVPIIFGDATRRDLLLEAGVERARMVVFAVSDFNAVLLSLPLVRELAPEAETIVRTRMFTEIEQLRRAGADQVVAEEFESAIEIFTRVLAAYHVPRNIIRAETRVLRGEAYEMLRTDPLGEVSQAVLEALEAGTTDIYRLAGDSPVVGTSLSQLDLRQRTDCSVIAVVRGEESYPNPSPMMNLAAGDCLVLVGSHQQIDRAFQFLDGWKSQGD